MFEQNTEILRRAEFIAPFGNVNDVLKTLRALSLWDFAMLMISLPSPDWPNLSQLLPRMASAEVQASWTGSSGRPLLASTIDFVRILEHQQVELNRRTLKDLRILDFGCGYGRLIRPLYYFTDPENIYGLDAWERSLEICRGDRLLGHFARCDFIPETLPLERRDLDLIFAYSVFTHTSLKVTQAILACLRRHIAPSGLLVITTRPAEWWHTPTGGNRGWDAAEQLAQHRRDGFSFFPSNWNQTPGQESIFGDTSFTAEWLQANVPFWHVEAYDRGVDQAQLILVLAPR